MAAQLLGHHRWLSRAARSEATRARVETHLTSTDKSNHGQVLAQAQVGLDTAAGAPRHSGLNQRNVKPGRKERQRRAPASKPTRTSPTTRPQQPGRVGHRHHR